MCSLPSACGSLMHAKRGKIIGCYASISTLRLHFEPACSLPGGKPHLGGRSTGSPPRPHTRLLPPSNTRMLRALQSAASGLRLQVGSPCLLSQQLPPGLSTWQHAAQANPLRQFSASGLRLNSTVTEVGVPHMQRQGDRMGTRSPHAAVADDRAGRLKFGAGRGAGTG